MRKQSQYFLRVCGAEKGVRCILLCRLKVVEVVMEVGGYGVRSGSRRRCAGFVEEARGTGGCALRYGAGEG